MTVTEPRIEPAQTDAVATGTTATRVVSSRARVPWRFIGSRAAI